VGLIFGKHDHRGPLRRTARTTLPPDIRDRVTAYDLRHSRLTWMLEHTQNLAGVAYQSGHRRTDTLATFYVHPSRRAQESVLRDCARARQLELFDEDRR
jgi:integrase